MSLDETALVNLQSQAHHLLNRFSKENLQAEIEQLQTESLASDFWQKTDAQEKMQLLGQKQSQYQQVTTLESSLEDLETVWFLYQTEGETEEYLSAINKSFATLATLVKEMSLQQYLQGKYDNCGVIFSLHAGQGGTEAMDWTQMLIRLYLRYFERKKFKFKLIHESRGEEAGIKTISYEVSGDYAYGLLKHEAGTHRLVRLSPFNADNLRQTSFSLVDVLPLIPESDQAIKIADSELSWHFTRSGGAGGQNVNKVNTAVELTYLPQGWVIRCREERSQEQNKQRALQILRAKLAVAQEEERKAQLASEKGERNTQASWGTQIRNYVLHPYQLVKDTRTGYETNQTTAVLDGEIDGFIEAALTQLT